MSETDFHTNLMHTIGRIEGKLDAVYEQSKRTNGRIDKHDDQLTDLQSFRDNAIGKVTVIGGVASFIFAFIGAWVQTHLLKT